MSNYKRENELLEQRKRLVEEGRNILRRAEDEKRDLTPEELANVHKAHADADEIDAKIGTLRGAEAAQAALEDRIVRAQEDSRKGPRTRMMAEDDVHGEARDQADQKATRDRAFRNWLRHGVYDLTPEERQSLSVANRGPQSSVTIAPSSREQRAQSVAGPTAGGYTVGQEMMQRIEIALSDYGGMREAVGEANILRTSTGRDIPLPTLDDTSNTGRILGENSAITETALTFGQIILGAHKYSSDEVLVSFELLQDSEVPVEQIVGDALGERIGRIQNTHFTTGTGNSQPEGVVTGATLGKTATGTDSITADELLDLKASVDPAYVKRGSKWMFNNASFFALRKLKDGSGNYLWEPGLERGAPNTIDGDPYVINQDLASIATGTKPILYGDFSKYRIRIVVGMRLLRLDERYADNDQVAFVAFMRADGKLIDAGQNPIKYLQLA